MKIALAFLVLAGSQQATATMTEDLRYVEAIQTFAWRMAGADFCEGEVDGRLLNSSLSTPIKTILFAKGVSRSDMDHYDLIYYLTYTAHLELGWNERLKDEGRFCRQVFDQLGSARLFAEEEFLAGIASMD